jgi:hypothetical protein
VYELGSGRDVVPVLVAGCSGELQPTVGRDSGCQPHPHSLRHVSDLIWAAEVRGCTMDGRTPRHIAAHMLCFDYRVLAVCAPR